MFRINISVLSDLLKLLGPSKYKVIHIEPRPYEGVNLVCANGASLVVWHAPHASADTSYTLVVDRRVANYVIQYEKIAPHGHLIIPRIGGEMETAYLQWGARNFTRTG